MNERASTPTSSLLPTGIGSRNEPAATALVAADSRRRERVMRSAITAVASKASPTAPASATTTPVHVRVSSRATSACARSTRACVASCSASRLLSTRSASARPAGSPIAGLRAPAAVSWRCSASTASR